MNLDAPTAFYCDMNAIPMERRQQHVALIQEIFGAVQTMRELPEGYAFQLPNGQGWLPKVAAFIEGERLCCPFFAFTTEVAAMDGPLWLQLTGPAGVKPFIQAELGAALNNAALIPAKARIH